MPTYFDKMGNVLEPQAPVQARYGPVASIVGRTAVDAFAVDGPSIGSLSARSLATYLKDGATAEWVAQALVDESTSDEPRTSVINALNAAAARKPHSVDSTAGPGDQEKS